MTMPRLSGAVVTACVFTLCSLSLSVCRGEQPGGSSSSPSPQWWKGNLHTHSLWSDGDEFPEMIADWYRSKGYHFLAITDHNVLAQGRRWMKVSQVVARSDEGILQRYRERFGDAWVQTRGEPGTDSHEVRLMPLEEFRALVEQQQRFLLIPAEEISDRAEGKPVHINATNIAEAIPPAGGATVREAMQNNLRAILEHEREHGREVFPHINHPNFGYAMTAADLAAVVSERFFEVYNGHPGVNHLGDETRPGVERMWDLANAIRRTHLNVPPLMGIATDDSHEYHGKPGSRPGRGWVMVRSRYLTPERLILALKAGDFYASSGVSLEDVGYDAETQTLRLTIQPVEDETYTTQFIATLAAEASAEGTTKAAAIDEDRIGVVVKTVEGTAAEYRLKGNELYVRAVVTSSAPPADPSFEGQRKQAWTQPVGWE
ncbi:PHP domain-containing protein [Roseimaritima sediminicola]|uniref:PHP domain-containing protein n=1 Tax=Roseimaritima sediminicola TaxID=2662066 RepID=UPI001F3391F0|nr:hypothetical protein [Roseimaritima sediminicola]